MEKHSKNNHGNSKQNKKPNKSQQRLVGKHSRPENPVQSKSVNRPEFKSSANSSNSQPAGSKPNKAASPAPRGKLSELQQKFAKKLEGSRFRIINEQLYTTSGLLAVADVGSLLDCFVCRIRGIS